MTPKEAAHLNDDHSANSSRKDKSRARGFFESLAGIAAVWTALLATLAIAFSSPTHVRGWFNSNVPWHRYSVEISNPAQGQGIGYVQQVSGNANIPTEWALVVVTQTPDELKYYVTSAGAVAVTKQRWTVEGRFGTEAKGKEGAKLRAADLNKPYKIFALVLDPAGQIPIQQALAKDGVLLSLPDAMLMDVTTVNLVR